MEENLKFYTVRQICERLQISKSKIYKLLREGKLKAVRLSDGPKAGWRIPLTELQRLHAFAYEEKKDG